MAVKKKPKSIDIAPRGTARRSSADKIMLLDPAELHDDLQHLAETAIHLPYLHTEPTAKTKAVLIKDRMRCKRCRARLDRSGLSKRKISQDSLAAYGGPICALCMSELRDAITQGIDVSEVAYENAPDRQHEIQPIWDRFKTTNIKTDGKTDFWVRRKNVLTANAPIQILGYPFKWRITYSYKTKKWSYSGTALARFVLKKTQWSKLKEAKAYIEKVHQQYLDS